MRRSQSSDREPTETGATIEDSVRLKENLATPLPSERLYSQLFERSNDMIFALDLEGIAASVNPAIQRILGFDAEEVLGTNFIEYVAPGDLERAGALLAQLVAGADVVSEELELVAKDGHRVFVDVSARPIELDGRLVGVEGIARDMTERHVLQEALTFQALHDSLTGLPNRTLFLDRIGQALARAERFPSTVAVMVLDVDNFKLVNDSLGHVAGDELLVAIARRLRRELRGGETVARLGGDEFVFVLESLRSERELIAVAERILSAFAEPFTVGKSNQHVTASLGVALAEQGVNAEALLRNADTAMYRAKRTAKGSLELFSQEMRARVLHEVAVASALEDALKMDQLDVYYQPIVSLFDGQILAVEALVRWLHPQWGWVSPNEFVPIAEGNGLIVPVGGYVLTEAARQAHEWRHDHPEALPLGVFVNISARQLSQPDFIPCLTDTLHDNGLAFSDLGIEVTERILIGDTGDALARNLTQLARMGIRLSLDDFGTGYSALASLNRFPFMALKIDRGFIRSIRGPADKTPITTAIVSLGQALGLTVVAEGVETRVQAEYLRRLGCHAAQGFYFARPQPASELSALLGAKLVGSDTRVLAARPRAFERA